ncbi:DUF4365 domain-containing protein [Paraburkholderia sediminicola]|uniref:DUF4365 domain-containing protein n=1 Tax=Paraburkholderia sediminicola TaxID=458836 RepID=UPI0038BAB79D
MNPYDPQNDPERARPVRAISHTSDAEARLILTQCLPRHWPLRALSEWDYGIDFLLEFTDAQHLLTSESALLQLKGKTDPVWTASGNVVVSGVKISTSNYWFRQQLPVFLVVADNRTGQAYYLPVKSFIRRNFEAFYAQGPFSYRVSGACLLSAHQPDTFLRAFNAEKQLPEIDRMTAQFPSFQRDFFEFFLNNRGRDFHMEVDEPTRRTRLAEVATAFAHCCAIFDVPFQFDQGDALRLSQWSQPDGDPMIEHDMTQMLDRMDAPNSALVLAVKERVSGVEREYWEITAPSLVNVIAELPTELVSKRTRRAMGLNW